FHKPVVIDMFCYRRHGHNEGDEPAFTQPVMYKKIASHPSTLEIYSKRLIGEGVMTEGEIEKAKADWRARLDAELEAGSGYKPNKADWLDGKWAGFKSADAEEDARRGVTGVDVAALKDIGRKITKVPDGFRIHRTIQRFLENRAKAIDSGLGIDWATGEALTVWEAQFGDFANGAQVLFDQFISSGERKWLRMSGLVCMLPHGYEGQGPEHSSARLERFLQMCAEDNMQVVHPTTPANFFHV